jgi:predicted metalloprotease
LLRLRYGWVLVLLLLGISLLGRGDDHQAQTATGTGVDRQPATAASGDLADFVGFVQNDVQRTWDRELAGTRTPYRHAKLVLFTDATTTACGFGQAATGPFYCPDDERVYIDLGFFDELEKRFGAQGDFAQAYVIAHEMGHHVQKILGISDKVQAATHAARGGASGLSVRLELQADCLAGVWAHFTGQRDLLEKGDLEEGLTAAASIGDDRLQRMSDTAVNPETWTHGSSEERARWFRRGYEQGTLQACDTFSGPL